MLWNVCRPEDISAVTTEEATRKNVCDLVEMSEIAEYMPKAEEPGIELQRNSLSEVPRAREDRLVIPILELRFRHSMKSK